MQVKWASMLEPPLSLPINSGILLQKVSLASGSNSINHLLQRKPIGWFITRQRSAATVYDTQDSNQRPELTLNLTASAAVTVDLYVF